MFRNTLYTIFFFSALVIPFCVFLPTTEAAFDFSAKISYNSFPGQGLALTSLPGFNSSMKNRYFAAGDPSAMNASTSTSNTSSLSSSVEKNISTHNTVSNSSSSNNAVNTQPTSSSTTSASGKTVSTYTPSIASKIINNPRISFTGETPALSVPKYSQEQVINTAQNTLHNVQDAGNQVRDYVKNTSSETAVGDAKNSLNSVTEKAHTLGKELAANITTTNGSVTASYNNGTQGSSFDETSSSNESSSSHSTQNNLNQTGRSFSLITLSFLLFAVSMISLIVYTKGDVSIIRKLNKKLLMR